MFERITKYLFMCPLNTVVQIHVFRSILSVKLCSVRRQHILHTMYALS